MADSDSAHKRSHSDDRHTAGADKRPTSQTTMSDVHVKVEQPFRQPRSAAFGRGIGRGAALVQRLSEMQSTNAAKSGALLGGQTAQTTVCEPVVKRESSDVSTAPKQTETRPKEVIAAAVQCNPVEQKPPISLLDALAGGAFPRGDASDPDLAKAQKRAGISLSIIEEYFKIGGNVGAKIGELYAGKEVKPLAPTSTQTARMRANEDRFNAPNVFDADANRRNKGQQYVEEVKKIEEQRIISSLKKQQMGSKNTSGVSISGNISSLMSLNSITTDMESVGTYLPQIPETIAEADEAVFSKIKSEYFGAEHRPKRTPLPIAAYEKSIVDKVKANRVVVIEGATGCGKTTQVPQYIAEEWARSGLPFNIVVTQPRRIAAKSVAKRVAEERGWPLGSILGYQIGMDKENVSADTRILYCTTGVLLQRLIGAQRMDNYSHIIIDEVHERAIETDLLLLVIKKLMTSTGTGVKIILMSATFDSAKVMEYFTIPIYNLDTGGNELISEVRPSHVKVDEDKADKKLTVYYYNEIVVQWIKDKKEGIYRDSDLYGDFFPFAQKELQMEKENPCIFAECVEMAARIIERGLDRIDQRDDTRGSVLVFLPGYEEIQEMLARLKKYPDCERNGQWKIYPLHSSIPIDKQNEIFLRPRGRERKIILATNIAESSITVPDVEYVIDFCLTKNLVCDLDTHIPVLRLEWAAQSNCIQRAGRAGRCQAGRVFRLVTESFFNQFQPHGFPEIARSPLELSVLRVKMLGMGSPKELLGLALDPPNLSDIYHSVLQLKQVGAFSVFLNGGRDYDEEDGDITTLGVIMSHLPIDIRLSKLIVIGHVFDVLENCIIIAACLSTQGMFRREFGKGLDAYKSRMAWADRSFSDAIAYLNAFKMYDSFKETFENSKQIADKWCRQNFLQFKRLLEIQHMAMELESRLKYLNITVPIRPNQRRNRHEEELMLKIVMCGAFYPNYFLRNEIDKDSVARTISAKDPYNTVAITGLPQNQGVIYANRIRQIFADCSRAIDLSFEDTKAYLTFIEDRNPLKQVKQMQSVLEDEGRMTPLDTKRVIKEYPLKDMAIKTAVYVSLAMKAQRNLIPPIAKFSPEAAKLRLERVNKIKSEELNKWQTMQSSRISVPMVMTRIKMEKFKLPAMDCTRAPIVVTHVEDPGNFYAQYRDPTRDEVMNELSTIINYDCETMPCDHDNIRLGDIVIAPFKDQDNAIEFGRAQVVDIERFGATKEIVQITVFFLDYGYKLSFKSLREISRIGKKANGRLKTIAPQAFHCQLAQVNPSPVRCFDNCWDRKSIEFFKSRVMGRDKEIVASVYSVVNRVVRVELFDERREMVRRGAKMSINDELVSRGYAEQWEESTQSRLNHEHRRHAQVTRPANRGPFQTEKDPEVAVYNSDNIVEIEMEELEPPFGQYSNALHHEKFNIRGPFSPLESTFTGITRQTRNRTVRIERDSVNCVVLEPDYLSKHSRLIVASSVGLGNTTGNINLRDTTLMPNIRGFPALMSLMFAPRVQFRVDKDKTQYVGAICGLGYDPITKKGYDPESDAEIVFDTDISREDVAKVNIIRFHISDLLKSRQQLNEYALGSLANKQRKVRRLVIELLDRRRRLQDFGSEYYSNYRWGFQSESELAPQPAVDSPGYILPLINPLKMKDFDWYKDIKDNLTELMDVQKSSMTMVVKCKLCKVSAYTFQDLTFHLSSDGHLDAVSDFDKYYRMHEEEKVREDYLRQRAEEEDNEDVDYFETNPDCDLDDDDEVEIMNVDGSA